MKMTSKGFAKAKYKKFTYKIHKEKYGFADNIPDYASFYKVY